MGTEREGEGLGSSSRFGREAIMKIREVVREREMKMKMARDKVRVGARERW